MLRESVALPIPGAETGGACRRIAATLWRSSRRHLHFAHGGRADLRGKHDTYYSFFSAPGMACNVKTENATFRLHGGQLLVHGSFITEAQSTPLLGDRTQTRPTGGEN